MQEPFENLFQLCFIFYTLLYFLYDDANNDVYDDDDDDNEHINTIL